MKIVIFLILILSVVIIWKSIHIYYLKKQVHVLNKDYVHEVDLYRTANSMLILCENGRSISSQINEMNIRIVSIYGMREIGFRVMEDLILNSPNTRVLYGIDRKAEEIKAAVPVVTFEEAKEMEAPDVIIVTVVSESIDELCDEIKKSINSKVIPLREFFDE